ncbi:MAG: hypothetical protein V4721_17490, partial [Bacteroidota bacterium]
QHFTPFNSAITYNSLGTRTKKYQQWANNPSRPQSAPKLPGFITPHTRTCLYNWSALFIPLTKASPFAVH